MRNWFIGVLIVAVVSVLGCQPSNKDARTAPSEVKVAVAGPFTGNIAAFGDMIKRGAELKAEQINNAGGISGMKLVLSFEDDTGNDREAGLVATRIATDRQILAVVGHFNSSCTLSGKPIYQRNGIVALSPGSTNVKVAEGSDWMFRNIYRDDFQGEFVAKYIKNTLKDLKTVAIFFDNDDYGRGLRDGFIVGAEKYGLEVVASEAYDRNSTDFKAQLTSIQGKKPDVIFISGLYTQAGLIVSQADEVGINTQIFGADGVDSPEFLNKAGKAAEGMYLTTPFTFDLGSEDAKQVAVDFESKYGVPPDTWAALSYDAVGMIADAIEKTYKNDGSLADNRKAIRDYLALITTPAKGYTGITGLTYFDKNGDCVKPAYVKLVKDGKFTTAPVQMLDTN